MRTLLARLTVAAALFGAAGCQPATPGAQAKTPEEKAVAAYILDNADDPASVEFDRWGPHDPNAIDGAPGYFAVRARWRSANKVGAKELHDRIFFLLKGRINFDLVNADGDDWIEAERRQKEFGKMVWEAEEKMKADNARLGGKSGGKSAKKIKE